MIGYLDCPECGEPCTTMPGVIADECPECGEPCVEAKNVCCTEPHLTWYPGAKGVCQCGALLKVGDDDFADDFAELVLQFDPEAGDIIPAGQTPLPFVQVGMIVRTPECPGVDLLVTRLCESNTGRGDSLLIARAASFDGGKVIQADSRHIRATCTIAVPFVSSETFTGRWAAPGVAEVERGL